jgi:hypothetical protein
VLSRQCIGGNPGTDQVRGIAWPEKLLTPMKDVVAMLVPTHTGASTEGFRDLRNGRERAQGQLKCSRQICWAVLVASVKACSAFRLNFPLSSSYVT